jgi:hypothetical protein
MAVGPLRADLIDDAEGEDEGAFGGVAGAAAPEFDGGTADDDGNGGGGEIHLVAGEFPLAGKESEGQGSEGDPGERDAEQWQGGAAAPPQQRTGGEQSPDPEQPHGRAGEDGENGSGEGETAVAEIDVAFAGEPCGEEIDGGEDGEGDNGFQAVAGYGPRRGRRRRGGTPRRTPC